MEKQSLVKEDYEVVVVDNASNDNTREIVERFKLNTTMNILYVREERLGLHYARNTGAKSATSDILVFTDDDMDFDSKWLESILKAFKSDKSIDCIGGKILIRWDNEPPSWVIPYEGVLGRLDYGPEMRILKPFAYINGGSFSIKKKRLFEAGGFNPDQFGDIYLGDGESGLCHKIHKAGWKMAWVPDAIVWHLQKVGKNATLSDMKRRYANNGAASAYGYFKYNNPPSGKLFLLSIYSYYRFLRCYCFSLMAKKVKKEYATNQRLRAAFHKEKGKYLFNLIFDADLRNLVKENDWLNA